MKRTLRLVGMAALVLLLAASCKKDEKTNGEKQMMTFSAGIEQGNSKTYLMPDGDHAYMQLWTEGDQISVNGSTITLDAGCGGKAEGTFSGEAVKADHYYAVYPANAWQNGNKAVFEIPAVQTYNGNGYPLDFKGPMYASSNDQTLQFNNLCGLMQLNLKSGVGKPLNVTKIEVVSFLVNECGLYGTSQPVDLTSDNPTLTIANTQNKSVTLNCGNGVTIGTEQATPFVIALPPYKFSYNGITQNGGLFVNVYVEGTDGIYASILYKKEITVNAGQVVYTEATICPQIILATTAIDEDNDVTATAATVSGSVMSLEHGLNVVEKGIVYQLGSEGDELKPESATYVPAGTTSGNDFSAELTGLQPKTSYYCWAYAKCKYRDAVDYDYIQYGGFISFTTKKAAPAAPEGALSGLFTINEDGDQVWFSQGNLWYGKTSEAAESATFNFENKQWDYKVLDIEGDIYYDPAHISYFMWSKYESIACSESYDYAGYQKTDVLFTNATETTAKTDFTVNGVNGKWRSLSKGEWEYLLDTRKIKTSTGTEDASSGKGNTYQYVKCNGNVGVIIYPDVYDGTRYTTSANISPEEFPESCVFLPFAGGRSPKETSITSTHMHCYWTSSNFGGYMAYRFAGNGSGNSYTDDRSCEYGYCVRLVSDAK